jgi:hypothetical protein
VSRSWIERIERGPSPRRRAGLAFGRDFLAFAVLREEGPDLVVQQARVSTLARFDPGDRATISAAADAVRELTADVANRYLPIHVSLADSLASSAVLELESLPAERSAQRSLARFRQERDGGRPPAGVDCQPLGYDDGKALLLTASLDEDWPAYVGEVLKGAGLASATLGINLFRQFNRFHDRLLAGGRGGALLVFSPDSWSALIWDREGRARVTRLRARARGASDHEAVAGELERLILAYVHGGAERAVENIHVLSEDAAVAEALDRRLKAPCVRLDSREGCRWEGGPAASTGGAISMALAAALA